MGNYISRPKKDSCFVSDGSSVLLMTAGNPEDDLACEHERKTVLQTSF